MNPGTTNGSGPPRRWLNRTVPGIGLASFFSDWSHEIATVVRPAFLATMGVVVGALWTWAGTTAAFGYCAVLFIAGAWLLLRAVAAGE